MWLEVRKSLMGVRKRAETSPCSIWLQSLCLSQWALTVRPNCTICSLSDTMISFSRGDRNKPSYPSPWDVVLWSPPPCSLVMMQSPWCP